MSKGKRKTSVVAMMAVLASLLLPVLASTPASATPPDHVANTLQGCKPGTYTLTPQPHCADGDYTTGNLGKSWNELDLVPYRLTQSAGNAAPANQTYSVAVVLDAVDGNPDRPGYDVISEPILNTALSNTANGNCAITVGSQLTKAPGFGGIEQSIYRILTITQAKNTTCVYDYYGRLAVGAHLFPGSSLHANVANETLTQGGSDVSIPVKEIAPQAINKTMTAVQDSDFAWTINKGVSPDHLQFGNVCDTTNLDTTLQTDVTITWTKVPGDAQDIQVHTLVEASNPAARVITVQVTDQLRSGTTVLQTHNGIAVDVPANTTGTDVLVYDTTVPAGTTNLNDIAVATYTDKLTGVPVPGNTIATATAAVQGGSVTNGTATITDVETITGAGLSFSVDSVTGDADALNGASLSGTNPVTWTSGTVSGGGSVVLHKTVTLDPSVGATSGALTDTATVTGSDGFTTSANEQVDLDSTLSGSLTINKSTTVPVDADTTFTFNVTGPGGFDTDVFVTVLKGATTSTTAGTLSNLAAGDYNVEETDSGPFDPAADQQFKIGAGANCTATLNFENSFGLASATALKVTDPKGGEEGWTFQLYLDNAPAGAGAEDTLVASDETDATGLADFGQITDEGNYYILELNQAGYVSDGGKNCTFTVDYPADANKLFDDCVITNTKNGSITIAKVTSPSPDLTNTSFPFTRSFGPNVSLKNGESSKISDLAPGTYSAAELTPAGWTLSSFTCDDQSPVTAIDLNPGEDIICTATNVEQTASIIVKKVTDPASDTTTEFTFDTSYKADFKLKNGEQDNSGPLSVNGGPYSVAEINVPSGWDLKSLTCDGNNPDPTSINLENNEVVTCTATNVQRGTIIVKKVTDPTGSAQSFEFTPSYNSGTKFNLKDGEQNDSGLLVPGKYNVAETAITGWDLTSATCDKGETINDIDVGAGETVTCTFNNRQRGTISVSKTLTNGPADTTFTFELRTLSDDNDPLNPNDDTIGTLLDSKVIAANNVPVQLNGQLVPGTYTICEVLPGPGWTSDLGGVNQYTLTIALDNSRVCGDFTVGAGEAKVVAVSNTRPGGAQLTIGFWKNHASCKKSNGGQAAVLDAMLTLAGHTLIGNLDLTGSSADCVKAVNVLNKTTIDGKTKKSSDPLFNMAAQLLAAKLNVTGGAGTCPASTNAINAAQALLVKYGWNGLTYSPALTSADAALANQLNTTLDLYNNGNLC